MVPVWSNLRHAHTRCCPHRTTFASKGWEKTNPLTGFRHVTLLLSVFRYLLSYITFNYYSSSAQVSYRLAFLSAAATYGIVVYKGHIARGRLQGSVPNIAVKLAGDENVQYLGK